LPPPAIRRPLTVALALSIALGLLAVSPVLLALAALARATGRRKPLIAVRLVLYYCVREVGVLGTSGALWLATVGGRLMHRGLFQRANWGLLRWYVHGIADRAVTLLQIEVVEHCPADISAVLADPAPVIVLSRHAGPGDTLFLIDRMLTHYRRRPSVVFRQAITLDPAIDLLASRLPHGVIDKAERDDAEALIEHLSARLRPRGALLLYPEGGNFTVERRRSALASLRRKGRHRAAAAAQQMENVLPPRPSGVLAALRGNPNATVLFVAHTGLGLAAYPRQIYREMPIGGTLRFCLWRVDRDDVPATEEGQVVWLNRWWQRIDRWIDEVSAASPT